MKKHVVSLVSFVFLLLLSNTLIFAQNDMPLAEIPGRIAYIGSDLDVYTFRPGENQTTQLTEDASFTSDEVRLYSWPTWSNDGRLAYFLNTYQINSAGRVDSSQVNVFVSADGATHAESVYTGENEAVQYAYWAPQDCPSGDGCRDLAVLLAGDSGMFIELIRHQESETFNSMVGTTFPPFYYSWSPDAAYMFWHRLDSGFTVYDIAADSISESLPFIPGNFQAPAWSPVDDRVLFGAASASSRDRVDLVVFANDEARTLASELEGPLAFSWSPDGNSIAYMASDLLLVVVDPVSGNVIARSPSSNVLAFFWSPDSDSIAYLTPASTPAFNARTSGATQPVAFQTGPGQVSVAWTVLNIETNVIHRYSAFVPTNEMWYLLSYFDQFSQSHRIWSPDSRYLVYGQMAASQQPIISILDTSQADSIPFALTDGVIGIWSFE